MDSILSVRARSPLFPSARDRAEIDRALEAALCGLEQRIAAGRVTPTIAREAILGELGRFDFDDPLELPPVIAWLAGALERGIVQVTHPRYFGLFNPAPTYPSQCADRLVAAFNPQLATWTTSPFAVELERHVIGRVAAQAGLGAGTSGHFTTGGSEANATALICALTEADPLFAQIGARGFAGQPRLYISREAHLAWIKIAHASGLGREAVCEVETDGSGRMCVEALERAVASDREQGRVPVLVVGTAGTTGAGMIDPLTACAAAARREGVWFHVDAAWAGAAVASPRLRLALAGLEQADSVTIDAHKWFATTMGCGMFLTARPDALPRAFGVSTSYMPSRIDELDPYVNSLQWSRRALGLRLFLSLATAGWDGYAAHVERAVEVAVLIRTELEARGWMVLNNSPVAVLCLVPPSGSLCPERVVRAVLASGDAFVSLAHFERREVVRVCVTHGASGTDDVAMLVAALEAARSG